MKRQSVQMARQQVKRLRLGGGGGGGNMTLTETGDLDSASAAAMAELSEATPDAFIASPKKYQSYSTMITSALCERILETLYDKTTSTKATTIRRKAAEMVHSPEFILHLSRLVIERISDLLWKRFLYEGWTATCDSIQWFVMKGKCSSLAFPATLLPNNSNPYLTIDTVEPLNGKFPIPFKFPVSKTMENWHSCRIAVYYLLPTLKKNANGRYYHRQVIRVYTIQELFGIWEHLLVRSKYIFCIRNKPDLNEVMLRFNENVIELSLMIKRVFAMCVNDDVNECYMTTT